MLISVVCPGCTNTFQVQDSLRGKPMRCPRPLCRKIFIVENTPPQPAAPAQPKTTLELPVQSGSVGDMLPVLPAELAEPKQPPARKPTQHVSDMLEVLPVEEDVPELPLELIEPEPSWKAPPPVRKGGGRAPDWARPNPQKPPSQPDLGPRVLEPGAWDAPPVRRGDEQEELDELELLEEETEGPADEEPHYYPDEHRPRGRFARLIILPFVLLTILAVGAGGVYVMYMWRGAEERIAKTASEKYTSGLFPAAATDYQTLINRFPTSEQLSYYQFRKEVSDLRQKFLDSEGDMDPVLDHTEQFVKEHQKNPLLTDHIVDIGNSLIKSLTAHADRLAAEAKDDQPLEKLKRASVVVALVKAVRIPKDAKAPDWSQIDEAFGKTRDVVARLQLRREFMNRLSRLSAGASYQSLRDFESVLGEAGQAFPELPASDEVRKMLESIYDGHAQSVQYVEAPGRSTLPPPDTIEPAILLDPLIKGTPGNARPGDGIVLALVRGVLYGLRASNGQVQWARRLGIDSTVLPVRVGATAGIEERILVLSTDTPALTALDLNGVPIWRYRLPTAVLGRPVVVDQRAYLATYKGEVHEIELLEGKFLGRYMLGQSLSQGGVREPGSRRIYFPADDGCIYVLDVGKKKCDTILYTRHPAGSLRNTPTVIPPEGEERPGYLILNQASGLDGVRLRVFDLPITDRRAGEKQVNPAPALGGWTWFSPMHDPEKMVLLSDRGQLGMFGIRQANNRDQAMFSLLPNGPFDLNRMLWGGIENPPRARGRSEIAQMEGDDLWVLAAGRLLRVRLAWGANEGPQMAAAWREPVVVGSPLHASQSFEDAGKTNLVLVTQPDRRSCAWATCLRDESGDLLWRRQLGAVTVGEPIPLNVGEGAPIWLTCDQAGTLYGLDPGRFVVKPESRWLNDSRNAFLAESHAENPDQPPVVLPTEDGKSAYVLLFPRTGQLIVRHVTPRQGERRPAVEEHVFKLTAAPGGQPAIVGSRLVIPLADGALVRIPIPVKPGAMDVEGGPNWRSERALPESQCQVVALTDSRFVTTNGTRGLTVWEWKPQSNTWTVLPPGKDEPPTLELRERITGIVRLPRPANATPRLAVTDSTGTVSLIEVTDAGGLLIRKQWDLGKPITSGPMAIPMGESFAIALVVDRATLVWIDPTQDTPVWTYTSPGSDDLVGTPRLVDGMILVTDNSGLYVGLDPKTGKPVGPGYQLPGTLTPMSGPVLFQPDRLLAPLSDGTLLLVPTARLRAK